MMTPPPRRSSRSQTARKAHRRHDVQLPVILPALIGSLGMVSLLPVPAC